LILLVLVSPLVESVSVSPPLYRYDFVPNQENSFNFVVDRADKIDVLLEFDKPYLEKYVKLIDPRPNSSARQVTVIVKLPEKLDEPGDNKIFLKAQQMASTNSGGISAVTAIKAPIIIMVPYPGYYFKLQFEITPVNQGETINLLLKVHNLGTSKVQKAYAIFDVYEATTKIRSLTSDTKEILSTETGELSVFLPTEGIKPGTYNVIATFYYEAGSQLAENTVNIGTLFVDIKDHTAQLEQGKINRFDVVIESRWNNQLQNVYSTIQLEGIEVKTPSDKLDPWEVKTQAGYIDTTNLAFGEHDVNLTVYYEGKTTSKIVKVDLIPGTSPSEQEKPAGLGLGLTPVAILIAIILILVLFDLGWLLVNKLRARKPGQPKAQTPSSPSEKSKTKQS